jgi:pimeloyl-ACP methyl ester carboxylesterase
VAVGDADVAYQVSGHGPLDLLYFYGLGSSFEHFWDMPVYAEFLRQLMSFSRLILFDRRGTGSSDRVSADAIPTWEEWTDDVQAVLDAAGSTRAAVFAAGDAGPIAILFGALHPERVSSLVLFNTTARFLAADDYPIGLAPEMVDGLVEAVLDFWAPSRGCKPSIRAWRTTWSSSRGWPASSGPPRRRAWPQPSSATSGAASTCARHSR